MKSIAFNNSCFDYLFERFQYLFEVDLITEICQFSELKQFEKDTIIIDIGQKVTHMPLIVSGSIKVITEDELENELLLYYLETGDTCAITLNCCSKHKNSAVRAISEMPSEVLMIPVEKMEDWMIKFKTWRYFVLDSFNTRLNEMLEAIDNLAFNDTEKRLYKYLQNKVIISHNVNLDITQNEIAEDLNTHRVVISRLLKKLELEGKIKYKRNQIEVFNYMN